MSTEVETVLTGVRGVAYFDGTPMLDLFNCSGTIAVDRRPYKPTNSLFVKEHVTMGVRASFRASIAKRIGTDVAVSLGFVPKSIEEAVTKRVFSVILQDSATGAAIYGLDRVEATNISFGIAADEMSMENLDFVAISARTEGDIATP